MKTSKAIILSTIIIVALAIMLLVIQFLLRKANKIDSNDGKLNLSFGIWFATLFFSGSLITAKTIFVFSEAIDNIYKISPSRLLVESFKTGALFIGLSIAWQLLWYFIINILSVLSTGKRKESVEIAADHYMFFLVRGVILIGFTVCLLPAFEVILRAFLPGIQEIFYH